MLFFSSSIIVGYTQGENLVFNHDFEKKQYCPYQYTIKSDKLPFLGWYSPSEGTPDLFDHCSEVNGVPKNFAGVSQAKSRDAYAGLYLGAKRQDYKEYLSQKLQKPITPGVYKLELFVKLASFSGYQVDSLHLAFDNKPLTYNSDKTIDCHHFLIVTNMSLKDVQNDNWQIITKEITVHDTVEYLSIGNMEPYDQMTLRKRNITKRKSTMVDDFAFYYIDDVSITQNTQASLLYFLNHKKPFSLNKVYFAFDSYTIPQESSQQLQQLSKFLTKQKDAKLTIYGYADSVGTKSYNHILSLKRANQIKLELFMYNVDTSRISIAPMGEVPGISPNHMNRKVEFFIESLKD